MSEKDKLERQLGSRQLDQRSQQPFHGVENSSQPKIATSQAAPPPKPKTDD